MSPPPIFDQGPYDPAPYAPTDPASWPQPAPPATLYQPGMWWTSTGTGTIDTQPVNPGDYLFAVYRPRLYGDWLWGDGTFGATPYGDWTSASVRFEVWDASLPPWQQPPFPNAGCAFDETRHPGWRIVIDALYHATPGRTYGMDLYGDANYGDDTDTPPGWADITRPGFQVNVTAGTENGAATVPVSELSIELHDDDGRWVDIAEPAYYFLPFVGNPVRVGFLDPGLSYHPVAVGTIETIHDDHDTLPRYVTIQAFGNDMDLSNDHLGWQRPAELASQRFAALMVAGGWRFGDGNLTYPASDGPLHADRSPTDITTRTEIDRTAMSVGWFFDTDRWGGPRLREWPHAPTGDPLDVVDCADGTDALLSPVIAFGADQSHILNVAVLSNSDDPQLIVRAEQGFSIARFGRKSRGVGLPMAGLAFADPGLADALAVRYVNRWAFIVRQVSAVDADTYVDPRWLGVIADLDTGRAVTVTRNEIDRMTLDGVVVGFQHLITPGRVTSTMNVATLTTSQ